MGQPLRGKQEMAAGLSAPGSGPPMAWFGPWLATDLMEVTDDPGVLDGSGRWAVQVDYEGCFTAARFADWRAVDGTNGIAEMAGCWRGPATGHWRSSLDQSNYEAAVARVREHIAYGDVYQANVTRVLTADLPDGRAAADILGLGLLLAAGNPAPHAGVLRLPDRQVACASPELFLGRAGDLVWSRPIKGTGAAAGDLLDKDFAENVMIVDLVRNDLARVAQPGSVEVPRLLDLEHHPGLVHLVSQVSAVLQPGTRWSDLLAATFPPGSVTGAPKSSACRIIEAVETCPRGPYCGAFGWVDADTRTAELAVAIRTFWLAGTPEAPVVAFGTGAGITWGSDATGEWLETELKAARLITVASGVWP